MMFHLRKGFFCFLLVLSLILPSHIVFAREKTSSEPVRLKVLLLPFLSYAPFFIAQEEGFFAEQQLQIEFVQMSSSAAAIPPLAQGDLDIVAGTLRISTLNAIIREGKIKFVSDKGHIGAGGCTYYGIIARQALVEAGDLKNPSQLKGKKICLASGFATSEGYFVEKLLNRGGVKLNEVEIQEHIPFTAELEAFKKGTIDLTVGGEPKLTRMVESKHGVLWMPVQEIVPDFQFDVIAYGPSILQKNREAGRRFIVAYLKAVRQYHQGKSGRNLGILRKYTNLDTEFLKKICWPSIRIDGSINAKSVLDFQDWSIKKGLLDRPATENQFWDPSFIEDANKILSSVSK
ncbi:MAG: ABC transporter substrate-binding protein [Syntrophaceae bacterium]|nr:ABC transporter substrate-binding protein [Syntrophaceae bacterium]